MIGFYETSFFPSQEKPVYMISRVILKIFFVDDKFVSKLLAAVIPAYLLPGKSFKISACGCDCVFKVDNQQKLLIFRGNYDHSLWYFTSM